MIWIDLASKKPTDADIPGWVPWSNAEWDAWKERSQELITELARLEADGDLEARNALIDKNDGHWGDLKPWLLALSHGKCWFSEVRDLYSHYDVEHFRPKKKAKALDGQERDGYWWLAFDYMNFRVCGNVGNRKKGGWFPLRDGSMLSSYGARCEECEVGYFLDPIDEEDVRLVAFDETGAMIATPGSLQWEQKRVEETVKRLKLDEHPALQEERRKIWQKVDDLIEQYKREKMRADLATNPVAKERLLEAGKKIRELADRKSELSAVAKWCVLFRNDLGLNRILFP